MPCKWADRVAEALAISSVPAEVKAMLRTMPIGMAQERMTERLASIDPDYEPDREEGEDEISQESNRD
jgi:hypothetical protein